mgnify:CR=1 FL=1
MINISNKTSRLSSILKMLDKSTLEQIKKDALNLATNPASYGCSSGIDFIYLLFSEKNQAFVCKVSKDVNSKDKFFNDGTSKKDNLIMLTNFFCLGDYEGLSESEIKNKIDYAVDNFLIESVNLYLLDLQKSLDSFRESHNFGTIYKFINSEVPLPFDFFNDEELQVLLEQNLSSNLFVCQNGNKLIFATETINRLSVISNKLLDESLDGLKIISSQKEGESVNSFGYKGFVYVLYRLKDLGYLANKDFFDKLRAVIVQDENVWKDFDYFYKNRELLDLKIIFDFKVDSEEEAKSLSELVETAVISFFSKDQKRFKTSQKIIKELLGSIKNSPYISDDFRIFGLPKKSLGINGLNNFFDL